MKITHELLEKYARGECTLAEESAIEAWFQSEESESSEFSPSEIENIRALMLVNIEEKQGYKVIPLYKKFTRYAAAAAVILMAFGAGYFVDKGTTDQIVQNELKDEQGLTIYGGNGGFGKIPGESFRLSFDGHLRLFNGSDSFKTIIVGEITYILEPNKSYFLQGDENSSTLIANSHRLNESNPLEGDFYISVIKS
ncbi:MAG: hypothetical protein AAF620_04630 [Bacteroidota bacterium]